MYIVSEPVKKETIEVGCKLKVMDRGVAYIAKVKLLFLFVVSHHSKEQCVNSYIYHIVISFAGCFPIL